MNELPRQSTKIPVASVTLEVELITKCTKKLFYRAESTQH